MKRLYAIAMFAVVGAAFSAQALADDTLESLSKQSGLSERKVRMVIGARTAFAEYRCCYDRSREQLEAAIGKEAVERLISGAANEQPQGVADTAVAVADGHD